MNAYVHSAGGLGGLCPLYPPGDESRTGELRYHDPLRRPGAGVKRRIKKGQFYHQPCFGCREFPAHFRWCEELPPCPNELVGERDLGWMLWDMDYTNPEDIRPLFFRGTLRDGVLEVPARESGEVRG